MRTDWKAQGQMERMEAPLMCSMGKCLVRLNTLLGTNRVKIKGHTDPEKPHQLR